MGTITPKNVPKSVMEHFYLRCLNVTYKQNAKEIKNGVVNGSRPDKLDSEHRANSKVAIIA